VPFDTPTYFLLFLPVAAATHALVRRWLGPPWAQGTLLAASLLFYCWAALRYLPILAASILFNWAIARAMIARQDPAGRRLLLWIGLGVDVAVLFLFKYVQLFLDTIAWFHGPQLTFPRWGFPLGVSFFTLNQIMYLVDAYPKAPASPAGRKLFRGILEPSTLAEHATFVTLFPYLVSGPLVRARATVDQFRRAEREPDVNRMAKGLFLFAVGLAKKVVLANSFAPVADAGFGALRDYSMVEAWAFCLAALLHLYFDFSGYSDMALGSAWMLGIDIPQNFESPLKSRSIFEFWQRWHISLSRFITDYLYTPLFRALGKPTQAKSALATLAAMLVAALWHGPAWPFVAWGAAHGSALVVNQIWKRRGLSLPDPVGWAVTFLFLTATIVFLRTGTLAESAQMLSRLLPHAHPLEAGALRKVVALTPTLLVKPVGLGCLVALLAPSSTQLTARFTPRLATAVATAALLALSLFFINSVPARTFVYFAF
jgi:D-alanyl-lipoteichoic acid acyltransferase DltB (MBOAT superfamily)